MSRRKLATAKRLSPTTVLFHFLVRGRPIETTRDFQTMLIDVFMPSAAKLGSEYHTAFSSSVAIITAGLAWRAGNVASCSGFLRLLYSAPSIPSPLYFRFLLVSVISFLRGLPSLLLFSCSGISLVSRHGYTSGTGHLSTYFLCPQFPQLKHLLVLFCFGL